MGGLTSLTGGGGLSGSGGAATGTVGDTRGGEAAVTSGISSPVVIGGFKSDGRATAVDGNTVATVAVAVVIVGVVIFLATRRKRR